MSHKETELGGVMAKTTIRIESFTLSERKRLEQLYDYLSKAEGMKKGFFYKKLIMLGVEALEHDAK